MFILNSSMYFTHKLMNKFDQTKLLPTMAIIKEIGQYLNLTI